MTPKLVIFLHGVGSQGAHLAPLGQVWQAAMPDTIFAAPDGPQAFDHGGAGRQWFSVRGVTVENRPARVVQARGDFDAVIGGIIASHGLTNRLHEVALVGFSQGSIMALDAVASGRWPVGAVVSLAGRLASPAPFAPASPTRIGLIHGDADPVMSLALAHKAKEALTLAGYEPQLDVVAGGAHTISAQEAGLALAFLTAR
jgi:phospholipase/carboxylesterase